MAIFISVNLHFETESLACALLRMPIHYKAIAVERDQSQYTHSNIMAVTHVHPSSSTTIESPTTTLVQVQAGSQSKHKNSTTFLSQLQIQHVRSTMRRMVWRVIWNSSISTLVAWTVTYLYSLGSILLFSNTPLLHQTSAEFLAASATKMVLFFVSAGVVTDAAAIVSLHWLNDKGESSQLTFTRAVVIVVKRIAPWILLVVPVMTILVYTLEQYSSQWVRAIHMSYYVTILGIYSVMVASSIAIRTIYRFETVEGHESSQKNSPPIMSHTKTYMGKKQQPIARYWPHYLRVCRREWPILAAMLSSGLLVYVFSLVPVEIPSVVGAFSCLSAMLKLGIQLVVKRYCLTHEVGKKKLYIAFGTPTITIDTHNRILMLRSAANSTNNDGMAVPIMCGLALMEIVHMPLHFWLFCKKVQYNLVEDSFLYGQGGRVGHILGKITDP